MPPNTHNGQSQLCRGFLHTKAPVGKRLTLTSGHTNLLRGPQASCRKKSRINLCNKQTNKQKQKQLQANSIQNTTHDQMGRLDFWQYVQQCWNLLFLEFFFSPKTLKVYSSLLILFHSLELLQNSNIARKIKNASIQVLFWNIRILW